MPARVVEAPKKSKPKLTAQGIPLEQVEQEERERVAKKRHMEQKVSNIIENAFLDNGEFVVVIARGKLSVTTPVNAVQCICTVQHSVKPHLILLQKAQTTAIVLSERSCFATLNESQCKEKHARYSTSFDSYDTQHFFNCSLASDFIRVCSIADIAKKPFIFIMADYFYKNMAGDYSPAELAVAKFNFRDGIYNTYHTFIDPGMSYRYVCMTSNQIVDRAKCFCDIFRNRCSLLCI